MFSTPFTYYAKSGIDYAQRFIDAAGITDSTQQNAIKGLVTNLTNYGLLSKCYALWPIVGGTADKHKWNLMNPVDTNAGYRLTFNGSITHSVVGMEGNNASFANTYWSPSTVLGNGNANVCAFIFTAVPPGGTQFTNNYPVDMACQNFSLSQYTPPANNFKGQLAGLFVENNSSNDRGFHAISGTPAGGSTYTIRRYINGSEIWNTTGTPANWGSSGSQTSGSLFLLADNHSSGTAQSQSDRVMCTAGIFSGLNATEVGNLNTTIATYNTALGNGRN